MCICVFKCENAPVPECMCEDQRHPTMSVPTSLPPCLRHHLLFTPELPYQITHRNSPVSAWHLPFGALELQTSSTVIAVKFLCSCLLHKSYFPQHQLEIIHTQKNSSKAFGSRKLEGLSHL